MVLPFSILFFALFIAQVIISKCSLERLEVKAIRYPKGF